MSYASLAEAMVYGHGIERQFRCHVHGDTTPSASVNSLTGLWFCYACGAKGKYAVSELPPAQATAAVRSMLDRLEDPVLAVPELYLDYYDALGPGQYWLSRFAKDTCTAHRLGQDHAGEYATIPVRDPSGALYGVIRRDLTGTGTKYRYPYKVNVSAFLYNYHRASGDVLLLTEGATDTIAAEEAGWSGAMATYRNGLSRAQQELVMAYDPDVLLVAYDQDAAGQRGAEQIKHDMAWKVRVDVLTWDTYKDLASMPLAERTDMFTQLTDTYA